MRIQNNITAMNTHRMYTVNNNNVAKSAEKLSSGYRINRAGDDAAGLAISEKMRAQIRGLNMASKNSQDAVSLVQTAEGALQEVHSMLQRMNELSVQSSTGTNDNTVDRAALQQEFQNLQDEIDQIATTTTFNDMNLLDGTLGSGKMQVAVGGTFLPQGDATAALSAGADVTVKQLTGISTTKAGTYSFEYGTVDSATGAFSTSAAYADNDDVLRVTYTAADGSTSVTNLAVGDILEDADGTAWTGTVGASSESILDLTGVGLGKYSLTGGATPAASADVVAAMEAFSFTLEPAAGATTGGALKIQVGAKESETLELNITAMNTSGLSVTKTAVKIDSQDSATAAITATRTAINTVSTQRAELGAMQNRLEHKIANLDNTSENLSAAESRIRDVDIAKEMTNFTKNNILSQAATAMLAQANAAPQGVLSLLQ